MPEPGGRQFSILVVDDDTSMREFLELLLSRENYEVATAENGKRALDLIRRHTYDLALVDIRLGDITGLEVLKQVKQRHPDTVVIMISAYSTTEIAVNAMNEGAYDFVPKPFDNDELRQTIAKALDLQTLEQEKNTGNLKSRIIFILIGSSATARE